MAEYSAKWPNIRQRTEYSAINEYCPNIRIRPNIRTIWMAEYSYSAETENPVSFEHCLRLPISYEHVRVRHYLLHGGHNLNIPDQRTGLASPSIHLPNLPAKSKKGPKSQFSISRKPFRVARLRTRSSECSVVIRP